MTGPSSTPRGERTPVPGATWETRLVRTETVVPDCPASTHGACLTATQGGDTCPLDECAADIDHPSPAPDRATRRALARAARRRKT